MLGGCGAESAPLEDADFVPFDRADDMRQAPGPILANQSGDALIAALVAGYKPKAVLGYKPAGAKLFGDIDVHDGKVTCVYSGFSTTDLFNHTGMNIEHTLPQSKGAVGNAKSDMHHLFTTEINANSYRGSSPFAEIPDAETRDWIGNHNFSTTKPSANLELYSERDPRGAGRFEPRHDHKGNAARAMFYMYTMYRAQADSADKMFFAKQKDTLLQWHVQDPPDAIEIERTNRIAAFESGKPNPFVLDPTLVRRAYFPTSDGAGSSTTVVDLTAAALDALSAELAWTLADSYDGAVDELLVLLSTSGTPAAPSGVTPASLQPSSDLGVAERTSDGSYVTYVGDGAGVTVTGLAPGTTYTIAVWLFENNAWVETQATGSVTTPL